MGHTKNNIKSDEHQNGVKTTAINIKAIQYYDIG
jgi:hypothetical protein